MPIKEISVPAPEEKEEKEEKEDKEEKEEKVIDKSMTVNELKKISASMNLPVSGNKTKLIERIQGKK